MSAPKMSTPKISTIKYINTEVLDSLTQAAQKSPRLRMNQNLHPTHEAPVQRLAIAMEMGTYVRPHRHLQSWEVLLPLRGSFSIVIFDDEGKELDRFVLGESGLRVVELPAGTWHSVAAREPNSIIFEVKEGPYLPISAADSATWAPADGTAEAAEFVNYVAGL